MTPSSAPPASSTRRRLILVVSISAFCASIGDARLDRRPPGFCSHRPDAFVRSTRSRLPPRLSPSFEAAAAGADGAGADSADDAIPAPHVGPVLPPDADLVAGVSLGELSLDLAVAPSAAVPGGLGLYVRLSDPSGDEAVASVTVPALTLLGGYSREGTFESSDVGDKTVAFALRDAKTAVFYQRRLMSVGKAIRVAAETEGDGDGDGDEDGEAGVCGLVGHEIRLVEEEGGDDGAAAATSSIEIEPVDDGFPRYFVPELVNRGTAPTDEDYTVQNFGQFCNDLAWSYDDPPSSAEEYDARSGDANGVVLVWRLEYDPAGRCLRPSWPVSVFARDVTFDNAEFMEIGTRYGWAYWQATVNLDKL